MQSRVDAIRLLDIDQYDIWLLKSVQRFVEFQTILKSKCFKKDAFIDGTNEELGNTLMIGASSRMVDVQ